MHAVALRGRDEGAHLFETFWRQPLLAAAALHGKAIGGFLIWPTKLMTAFVRVNPLLDGRRDAVEQLRVHDKETGIGRAVIVELPVNHGRALAAELLATVEREFPRRKEIAVAANRRDILVRSRDAVANRCGRVLRARRRSQGEQDAEAEPQEEAETGSLRSQSDQCFQKCPHLLRARSYHSAATTWSGMA